MSERARDMLVVVFLVVLLLALFAGLLALRRGRAGSGPVPGGGPTGSVPGLSEPQRSAPSTPAAGPGSSSPAGAVAVAGGSARSGAAETGEAAATEAGTGSAPTGPWAKRAPADFTEADLAQCGQGVQIDLGQYEVPVGQEFEVSLALSAPALESLTLCLGFDAEALALVPSSAAPVGTAFRSGIEGYAGKDGRTLVLIHAGMPGRKNLDAASGGAAVVWRMRALRVGSTRLEVLPRSGFTNARGESETYTVAGGEVSVR